MKDIRLAAYTDLQTETQERSSADDALSERIDNLPDEIHADIQAETQARKSADLELKQDIETVSEELQNALVNETQGRISADTELRQELDNTKATIETQIQNEAQSREQSDANIRQDIEELSDNMRSDLQLEAQAREDADGALSDRIDSIPDYSGNIQDLRNADQALNSRVFQNETALLNLNAKKLEPRIVQELPSQTVKYDFSDGISQFANDYRTACSVLQDAETLNYYQLITNSGNSNTYRRAFFNCMDILSSATHLVIDLDFMLSNRWHIGFADLSQRPGGSSGSKYTTDGVAFYFGTADDAYLNVCGTKTNVAIKGVWLRLHLVLDMNKRTAAYSFSDRDRDVTLASGAVAFSDTELTLITGIEAYTWYVGDLKIDNINITSTYNAENNILYLLPSYGNNTDAYVFVNNSPFHIGNGYINSFSTVPQQIGTWVDTTPVWRVAFVDMPIPYNPDRPELYEDMCYGPFYDYENLCNKYVKSTDGVFILKGLFSLNVSGSVYIGDLWSPLEYSFDISEHHGFINRETMYFTGYVDFVSPNNNIYGG